jgi:shikimate dehydrogenase
VRGRHVTLLGAGGSARAIAFALRDAGAHLIILNRTEQHAQELAEAVGDNTRSGGLGRINSALRESSILINTTTIGMAGTSEEGQSPVPDDLLRPEIIVMDIVSEPRETPLLRAAQARGCRVVYGYRMLLWQGVYKFQMYTGVEPPIDVMEQAMERVR